jgi:putative ABC transport system ATP-binding protein
VPDPRDGKGGGRHPQLILADEPTGNLDSRAGAQVVELLQAAHDAGRTVVIATHDLRLASQADRILRTGAR